VSEEAFVKKFPCARTHCLRQQLFDASVVDQVSRLSQEFLSGATSRESAQSVNPVVGRPDSKIAGGVMDTNFKNEFALLKEKPIFFVGRDANGVFFAISG
jgi:hypothetical protein